ncbi:tail fiber protein [Paenibacillus zeisoli]|uniref:tail fiber protein n=1 Tax=Paenibacillus zeisoli TaxID=2496267 RepID=UPI001C8DBFD6|nr:tail fiber protein [Paenibacillus zeisoli]
MASSTPNLNLLKKNPATDGNDTFNIDTMLNQNWDKIDGAIGKVQTDLGNIKIDIPDATLTSKGKVQLSSSTSGTSESLAATEKAVKDAYDRGSAGVMAAGAAETNAKNYTDQVNRWGAL